LLILKGLLFSLILYKVFIVIKYCDVAPVFSLSHSHGAAQFELPAIDAVKMRERVDK